MNGAGIVSIVNISTQYDTYDSVSALIIRLLTLCLPPLHLRSVNNKQKYNLVTAILTIQKLVAYLTGIVHMYKMVQ